MRVLVTASFLAFLLSPTVKQVAAKPTRTHPEIKVVDANWQASLRDIHAVLHSASSQLWPHAAQQKLDTIVVNRSKSGPIVLFRRGDKGQYFVNLDTHQQFWCQYA